MYQIWMFVQDAFDAKWGSEEDPGAGAGGPGAGAASAVAPRPPACPPPVQMLTKPWCCTVEQALIQGLTLPHAVLDIPLTICPKFGDLRDSSLVTGQRILCPELLH